MNKKGFTLVELLAVLVVLSIVVGITVPSVNGIMNSSRSKSEKAFAETIKDAMDIYLSSSAKSLSYVSCSSDYEKLDQIVTFKDVMNSPYKPLKAAALLNPANEKKCNENVNIALYRNKKTYVYYYVIEKENFGCFEYTTKDSNAENYNLYISNMEKPENPPC